MGLSQRDEDAADLASKEEVDEIDMKDKINDELDRFTNQDNVSFFAFTATPKGNNIKAIWNTGTG